MRTNLINTIRSLCVPSKLIAAAFGLAILSFAADASAWPWPSPKSPIIYDNGTGTTVIMPDRQNLWANIPLPGTVIYGPNGRDYIGLDGKPHGEKTDGNGNMVLYSSNPAASKPAATNNSMTAPVQRPTSLGQSMPVGRPAGTNVYPSSGSVTPVYNVRPNVGYDSQPTFRPTPQYIRTR